MELRTLTLPGGLGALTPVESTQKERAPFLVVLSGRGRVGKTTTGRALAELLQREQPAVEFNIWDCDPEAGLTGGLARYFPHAESYRGARDGDDRMAWLEQRLSGWFQAPKPTLLDLGADDRLIKRLGSEVNLVGEVEAMDLPIVALHVVGAQVEDLRYFESVERANGLFRPACAVLLMNAGMTNPLVAPAAAFAAITQHSAVVEFLGKQRGGRSGIIPRLPPDLMHLLEANPTWSMTHLIEHPEVAPDGRGMFHAMRLKHFLAELGVLRDSLPEHLP